jgi:hypothetical protein
MKYKREIFRKKSRIFGCVSFKRVLYLYVEKLVKVVLKGEIYNTTGKGETISIL